MKKLIKGDGQKSFGRFSLHDLIWEVFLGIVILIAVLLVISRMVPHSNDGWWNGEYDRMDTGWALISEDGSSSNVSFPTYIDIKANKKITLVSNMPDHVTDGSSLMIYCMKQDMIVYIGGQRVGTYMGSSSHLPVKWYSIRCDSSESGKSIKIILRSDHDGFAGCLNSIYIGEFSTIIYHIAAQNVLPLISGLLNFIIGIVVLTNYLLFVRKDEAKKYLYMGLYMIILGVWLIIECRMNQTFLSTLGFAQTFYYLGLLLSIIPMLLYGYESTGDRYRGSMAVLVTLSVAVTYFFIIGILFRSIELKYSQPFIFIYLAVCWICMITVLTTALHGAGKNEKKELQLDLAGNIIIGTGMLHDTFIYIYQRELFSCNGVGVAVLGLSIAGLIRFSRFQTDKRIEEMNALKQNSERTQFLADMSHAIRTPTNAVLGMNDLILRESNDEAVTGYAQDIKSAGNALMSSIGDILDLSDIESGKIELKDEEYNVKLLIDDCCSLIEIRAHEKKLRFNVDCDQSLPSVLIGDEKRIRQIVINLLTNAVKYSSSGSVTLAAGKIKSKDKDSIILEIEVVDTGTGISDKEQKTMFSPYERLDESKNKGIEGTGLGLALTKKLVDAMKGSITVESIYGAGSKFDVRIEQKIPKDTLSISESGKQKDGASTQSTVSVKWFKAPDARILAVDDVSMNLKVMKGLISETEIMMDTAESGEECLKKTDERYYDLIFMDDMMPGLSGSDTYELMKKDESSRNKNTPVIMLTANAVMGAKEKYLKEGFAAYISKPIAESELRDMMRKFLPEELVLDEDQKDDRYYDEEDAADSPLSDSISSDSSLADGRHGRDEQTEERIRILGSILNTEEGMKYSMDNPEMYLELLGDYVTSERHDMIADTYGKKDWTDYRISVHSLKSTSKMLGADDVSEEARLLEEAAGRGNIQYITENHDIMMKDYEELLGKIWNVIS